jgi:hypothetical protein
MIMSGKRGNEKRSGDERTFPNLKKTDSKKRLLNAPNYFLDFCVFGGSKLI